MLFRPVLRERRPPVEEKDAICGCCAEVGHSSRNCPQQTRGRPRIRPSASDVWQTSSLGKRSWMSQENLVEFEHAAPYVAPVPNRDVENEFVISLSRSDALSSHDEKRARTEPSCADRPTVGDSVISRNAATALDGSRKRIRHVAPPRVVQCPFGHGPLCRGRKGQREALAKSSALSIGVSKPDAAPTTVFVQSQ